VHRTSFLKMASFYETYIKPTAANRAVKVLDIGSKSYSGHPSYRDAIVGDSPAVTYVGLDLEHGQNVDLVPKNPFVWAEIAAEEFDFCISGQTFEHNPYFWVTFAEIARVLKPGGVCFIIAPGKGQVHRYPIDCWRFYPDSWAALCRYSGLELVENCFEDNGDLIAEPSLMWCDSSVIARKPVFASVQGAETFYRRIAAIAATIPDAASDTLPELNTGPCISHYVENNEFRCGLLKRGRTIAKHAVKRLLPWK
jgi:SAM-dependent methyltransferase